VEWLCERGRFEEALHTAESQVPAQPELCDKVRAQRSPSSLSAHHGRLALLATLPPPFSSSGGAGVKPGVGSAPQV
jgi:hypothetical protein